MLHPDHALAASQLKDMPTAQEPDPLASPHPTHVAIGDDA